MAEYLGLFLVLVGLVKVLQEVKDIFCSDKKQKK